MAEGEPAITFTVKEILARVDGKVDLILAQLAGKASLAEVDALKNRVDSLEDDLAIERALAKRTARVVFYGVPGFTAFIGTALAIVFRFVQ